MKIQDATTWVNEKLTSKIVNGVIECGEWEDPETGTSYLLEVPVEMFVGAFGDVITADGFSEDPYENLNRVDVQNGYGYKSIFENWRNEGVFL